jgi:hypothetical protein
MVSSEDSAWDVPPSIFGTRAGGPTVQRWCSAASCTGCASRGELPLSRREAIRGSHSKISRMEHGRVGFKERDVGDLLTLYGVTDSEERAALLNLAREANTPGWWHAYSDVLPPGWSPMWAWRRRRRSSGPTRSSSCRGCCRPKATPAP